MKVRAKHWINVNGDWHKAGEIFEVESVAGINGIEVIACEPEAVAPVAPEAEEPAKEKPKEERATTRRSRKTNA